MELGEKAVGGNEKQRCLQPVAVEKSGDVWSRDRIRPGSEVANESTKADVRPLDFPFSHIQPFSQHLTQLH